MEHTRRTFLGTSALGVATISKTLANPTNSLKSDPLTSLTSKNSSTPPTYKIIYNWDGAPHDYSEFPQSLDQFLEKTYAPIKDTQVGAHFWCMGEHEAKWPSKTMEWVGHSQGRVYNSVRSMRHNEGIYTMFKRGENPYQALVERGHQLGLDVYASIRMNDNHFNGLQPENMQESQMEGLTKLRKDHPEWCLGRHQAPTWFAASWNFSVPQIREHRLQHVSEVAELAEWDGIELDWQRHAFHLPINDAYRLRYTLTDMQRALRKLTKTISQKRGKPLYLAVRVATTIESCNKIGYDLKTWIKEGLCDMIIAGGGAGTDYGIEVEAFQNLLKGSGIHFYAGFDSGFWGSHQGLDTPKKWDHAMVRGAAKAYWERGANGMYVFNWHANEKTRRPLLTTIGTKKTLNQTNKVYAALHRRIGGWPFSEAAEKAWAGADLHDRIYGETPVELYPTLTEEGPSFNIGVYDNVRKESQLGNLDKIELQIEFKSYSSKDRVEVQLDRKILGKPTVHNVAKDNPDNPSDVSENSWLVWSLGADQINWGLHQIQIRLLQRDLRIKEVLTVNHVEIHLKYK